MTASPSSYRVLILCTGNICRSPVAEEMLRHQCVSESVISFSSAGIAAPIGVPPDAFAVAEAAKIGYGISVDKRSEQVTVYQLESVDLVLVMDKSHRAYLGRRFPRFGGKIFLLGHWGEGEIADPIGKDASFFRMTVEIIERATMQWSKRLMKQLESAPANSRAGVGRALDGEQ